MNGHNDIMLYYPNPMAKMERYTYPKKIQRFTPARKRAYEEAMRGDDAAFARASRDMDRSFFWNTLASTLPQHGQSFRRPTRGPVHIVALGCGSCPEAPVLNAYFGSGWLGRHTRDVRMTGIDPDRDALERAMDMNAHLRPGLVTAEDLQEGETIARPPRTRCLFIEGDARGIPELIEHRYVPPSADIAIIRNQEISADASLWGNIFGESLRYVEQRGFMFMTSTSAIEHNQALASLRDYGAVVTSRRNQWSVPGEEHLMDSDGEPAGRDKYVAVISPEPDL